MTEEANIERGIFEKYYSDRGLQPVIVCNDRGSPSIIENYFKLERLW